MLVDEVVVIFIIVEVVGIGVLVEVFVWKFGGVCCDGFFVCVVRFIKYEEKNYKKEEKLCIYIVYLICKYLV